MARPTEIAVSKPQLLYVFFSQGLWVFLYEMARPFMEQPVIATQKKTKKNEKENPT